MKKKIFIAILIIIGITTVFSFFPKSDPRSGYIFTKAKKASITEVVSESGTITSDGSLPIYSPTNGILTELYVKNGQSITKNQPLFKVISSASEQEKQTAYAQYLTAKTTLDADTARLHTLESLMFSAWKTFTDLSTNDTYENNDKTPRDENRKLPEFITAQNDWQAAEENYINQKQVLTRDQAGVSSAYNAYLATQTSTIKSQLSGIIENIAYSQGNSIHNQSTLSPTAKPVLVIKNSDTLEAVVSVGQTYIAKIKLDQPAIIKPDAYKDKKYTATVIRIDNIGENNQGIVKYNVYLKVDADESLKPGMSFDCDITTQSLTNVLTVPNSAVVINEGQKSVRVFENNKMKYIPVITGLKGETQTQILEGVSENQEIISALSNSRAERPGFLGL